MQRRRSRSVKCGEGAFAIFVGAAAAHQSVVVVVVLLGSEVMLPSHTAAECGLQAMDELVG